MTTNANAGKAAVMLAALGVILVCGLPPLADLIRGPGLWTFNTIAEAAGVALAFFGGALFLVRPFAEKWTQDVATPDASELARRTAVGIAANPQPVITAIIADIRENPQPWRTVFDQNVYPDRIERTDNALSKLDLLTQAFSAFRDLPDEIKHLTRELRDNTTVGAKITEGLARLESQVLDTSREVIEHGKHIAALAALYDSGVLPDRRHSPPDPVPNPRRRRADRTP